jgi:hypothetical protein
LSFFTGAVPKLTFTVSVANSNVESWNINSILPGILVNVEGLSVALQRPEASIDAPFTLLAELTKKRFGHQSTSVIGPGVAPGIKQAQRIVRSRDGTTIYIDTREILVVVT